MWWFDDRRSFLINKQWVKQRGQILDNNNTLFNTTNYQSLVRQLNLYGFRKVKRSKNPIDEKYINHIHRLSTVSGPPHEQDIDEFRHTFFRGDQDIGEEKIKYIKRQKPFKPTAKNQAPEPWPARQGGGRIPRSPPPFSDNQSMSQLDPYDDYEETNWYQQMVFPHHGQQMVFPLPDLNGDVTDVQSPTSSTIATLS